MSNLNNERIEQYANDNRMCNVNDEIREMARRLLAAEAELQEYRKASKDPVAWTDKIELEDMIIHGHAKLFKSRRAMGKPDPASVVKLYAAPSLQAVTVPDVISITRAKDRVINPNNAECFSQGWNACRAAMLAAAPQQ